MMQYKPTLIVNRLLVFKAEKIVFDEVFHNGLNVFYGANGGGKTSIMQLLVYSLGYNVTDWKIEAGSCDEVYSEVEINDSVLTFRRKINANTQQSLQMCYMKLHEALATSADNWKEYPYSISKNKESFSQKIFDLLGMPEVKFDDRNNVTLHQIFRLIYSDQSTPARFIFNNEQWDSGLKREIIGKYLLGLYDNTLYNAKIEFNRIQKEFEKKQSDLKAMYSILKNSEIVDEENSEQEYIEKLNKKNSEIYANIEIIKKEQFLDYGRETKALNELSNKNITLKQNVFEIESEINYLTYEIEDSKYFIKELQNKFNSITDSISIKEAIHNIDFEVCPSCLSKIEHKKVRGECSLCGNKEPEKQAEINLLRMKNEIHLQLKESTSLLEKKEKKLYEIEKLLKNKNQELKKNIAEIAPTYTSINSSREKDLFELYRVLGENQEKIDNYKKLNSLFIQIDTLKSEIQFFEKELEKYQKIIDETEQIAYAREYELNALISSEMCLMLKQDTIASTNEELESKFHEATKVEYDFASNAIIVNGQSVFSESSMFLLNNIFHLAILIASTKKEYVRFPRLLILDGIENGGMSDARSINFQKIIQNISDKIEHKHQIFIATRSIHPDLKTSDYQIGEKLTASNKSIKL